MGVHRRDAGREEAVCRIAELGHAILDAQQWLWYNYITEGEGKPAPFLPKFEDIKMENVQTEQDQRKGARISLPIDNMTRTKSASGSVSYHCGDQVARALTGLNLDHIKSLAADALGVDVTKYEHLNPGQQRMTLGNVIRNVLRRDETLGASFQSVLDAVREVAAADRENYALKVEREKEARELAKANKKQADVEAKATALQAKADAKAAKKEEAANKKAAREAAKAEKAATAAAEKAAKDKIKADARAAKIQEELDEKAAKAAAKAKEKAAKAQAAADAKAAKAQAAAAEKLLKAQATETAAENVDLQSELKEAE